MAAPICVLKLLKSDLKLIRFFGSSSLKPTTNHTAIKDDYLFIDKSAKIEKPRSDGVETNEIFERSFASRLKCKRTLARTIRTPSVIALNSRTHVSINHLGNTLLSAFYPQDVHPGSPGAGQLLSGGKHDLQSTLSRLYCTVSVTKTCWNCHALTKLTDKSEVQFFCDTCNAIQPLNPESNYFQTMQCDETFDLDTAKLTQTFRNLQRKLHPDKFSIMSKEEQGYSAMQSSEVNKAYSTLLKPLSRGLYLLELNGLTIEEGDSQIEPGFLMEVMETNETLAETKDEATVKRLGEENAVQLEVFLGNLSQAFSDKNYPLAREILMRLKYFSNIDDKVKERLEKDF